MAKRTKRRGSSKAGRPRKSAPRYPSGKLKPMKPNQILMDRRAEIAPDPTMSTAPMDCALANGWISRADHATGTWYAETHRRCGFRVGSVTASSSQEVELMSEVSKLSFSEMSDEMIIGAWENAMERSNRSAPAGDGAKLSTWSAVNAALTEAQRREVYLVCVLESWPFWLTSRLQAKRFEAHARALAKKEKRELTDLEKLYIARRMSSGHDVKHRHLTEGLKLIRIVRDLIEGRVVAADQSQIQAVPSPPKKKFAETTLYVDEDGVHIREVVRLVPVDQA